VAPARISTLPRGFTSNLKASGMLFQNLQKSLQNLLFEFPLLFLIILSSRRQPGAPGPTQARPRPYSSWPMQCPTHSLPRACVGLDAEKMAGLMVASNSSAASSASYPRLQLCLYALLTLPPSSQTPPSPSQNQKPSSPRILQSRQTTETSTPSPCWIWAWAATWGGRERGFEGQCVPIVLRTPRVPMV
jgi:hypothetical protein